MIFIKTLFQVRGVCKHPKLCKTVIKQLNMLFFVEKYDAVIVKLCFKFFNFIEEYLK